MMPSSHWLQLSYVCGSYDKVFLLGALKNPTFPQARLAHQDHVLTPSHEVARDQLLDDPPIQSLGVELP